MGRNNFSKHRKQYSITYCKTKGNYLHPCLVVLEVLVVPERNITTKKSINQSISQSLIHSIISSCSQLHAVRSFIHSLIHLATQSVGQSLHLSHLFVHSFPLSFSLSFSQSDSSHWFLILLLICNWLKLTIGPKGPPKPCKMSIII